MTWVVSAVSASPTAAAIGGIGFAAAADRRGVRVQAAEVLRAVDR